MKRRSCIYILEEIWKEFLAICKREGENASQKLENFMKVYNEKHRPGNPQLTLLPYAEPESPQPIRVLCPYCDGALSGGKVFCQWHGGMWIPAIKCYSCKHNRLAI